METVFGAAGELMASAGKADHMSAPPTTIFVSSNV
jgi:hypothetical protein